MGVKACAIDPGASTGIAMEFDNDIIATATVPTPDGDIHNIIELLLSKQPRVIIIERFITRGNISRYGLETIELVGAVKTLVYLASTLPGWPIMELIRRTPAQRATRIPQAKKILTARREEHGFSFTKHEVDALAHLLGWQAQPTPISQALLDKALQGEAAAKAWAAANPDSGPTPISAAERILAGESI